MAKGFVVAMLAATAATVESKGTSMRKPPMGFSSWNHFHMGVTAPLLLDTADLMISTGLQKAGYEYINTDDGWNEFNRTAEGKLQPSSHFTNSSMKTLTDSLHAKNFKFGIYGAAGFTTCGRRAGTLYHEYSDAAQYKAWGVDYLKYDDCGEANIQSYAKYFVMKDALAAAYGADGIDYYSYEPFQVYGADSITQMQWVSSVGDLWRSGGDITSEWKTILHNAHEANQWASNAKPGHYNDADMLEIGNGVLTLAEQRSHFALWCVIKSPLIIGADVSKLSNDSLTLLKTPGLIAVNQDELGIQGTLRVAMSSNGSRAPDLPSKPLGQCIANPAACPSGSKWMTHCSFGDAAANAHAQHWVMEGQHLQQVVDTNAAVCLTRADDSTVSVTTCLSSNSNQNWDFGSVNTTVAQIRAADNTSSCLTFNASSFHMEECQVEHGDKTTPNESGCTDGGCRFSGIIFQLWYLNSLKQLTSAITNIQNGDDKLLPGLKNFPENTPWCLATSPTSRSHIVQPSSIVDNSQPLQVWAGPLGGGDVVVQLFNMGNGTHPITAEFADVGLKSDAKMIAVDLWTGKSMGAVTGEITADVASHDSAVFRLSPA